MGKLLTLLVFVVGCNMSTSRTWADRPPALEVVWVKSYGMKVPPPEIEWVYTVCPYENPDKIRVVVSTKHGSHCVDGWYDFRRATILLAYHPETSESSLAHMLLHYRLLILFRDFDEDHARIDWYLEAIANQKLLEQGY